VGQEQQDKDMAVEVVTTLFLPVVVVVQAQ
jgi:hypothetical protein